MAHAHNLAIFRGYLKFKSNTQKIWGVLILLSIVTAVEVVLGIYKPDSLMVPLIEKPFDKERLLNFVKIWIFLNFRWV